MKISEKGKYVAMGMAISAVVMGNVVPTIAKNGQENITAIYKNIKIVNDGVPVDTGKAEPFIANGTTYLPVRAVGEAIGKNVSWDGSINTVYIGKRSLFDDNEVFVGNGINDMGFQSKRIFNKYKNEYNTQNPIEDNIGNKYTNYFLIGIDAYGISSGTWAYVEFPLNGEYKEFRTTLGITKDSKDVSTPRNIKIFADDKLIIEKTVGPGFIPEDINLNVSGALKLKVQVSVSDAMRYADTGFFNARFIK